MTAALRQRQRQHGARTSPHDGSWLPPWIRSARTSHEGTHTQCREAEPSQAARGCPYTVFKRHSLRALMCGDGGVLGAGAENLFCFYSFISGMALLLITLAWWGTCQR